MLKFAGVLVLACIAITTIAGVHGSNGSRMRKATVVSHSARVPSRAHWNVLEHTVAVIATLHFIARNIYMPERAVPSVGASAYAIEFTHRRVCSSLAERFRAVFSLRAMNHGGIVLMLNSFFLKKVCTGLFAGDHAFRVLGAMWRGDFMLASAGVSSGAVTVRAILISSISVCPRCFFRIHN